MSSSPRALTALPEPPNQPTGRGEYPTMKAVSLFSGVGGFEIGFERAGIETVLQAERDPHCREVLARHWPQTERVDDVREVGASTFGGRGRDVGIDGDGTDAQRVGREGREQGGGIDLVYGGFPCQDLSVAGKRAGLGGERSGLWFEFYRVLSELRPRWAVVENVPGLLSSNEGRDFAVILDGLGELGFSVGWAVLDAQHFGVPQRRRRVFVVAGPSRRGVEQVLSLCESCGGNPETSGTAREGLALAPALRASGVGSERIGDTRGQDPLVVSEAALKIQADALDRIFDDPPAMSIRTAQTGSNGWGVGTDEQAYTLDGAQGQAVLANAISARDAKGGANVGWDGKVQGLEYTPQGVRRPTPLECERLMGWPDDWTRWTQDGREISDSHRYRMAGNGVVSTVAEWIGHRLVAVDVYERQGVPKT